jgi:hypothetical protein
MFSASTPEKVTVVCPVCGKAGSAVLSSEAAVHGRFSMEKLTSLSDEFYFRMPRSAVGPLDVVCAHCGAVLA